MVENYKVILSNRNIYKEVELTAIKDRVVVGTTLDSDVRLHKQFFFGESTLSFIHQDKTWAIFCSDNLYIASHDARKLSHKKLEHGEELQIKYHSSAMNALLVTFIYDFDSEQKEYDLCVILPKHQPVIIGGSKNSHLRLLDKNLTDIELMLNLTDECCVLYEHSSTHGVYVNGQKMVQEQIIENHDFITLDNYSFYYCDGNLFTSSKAKLTFTQLVYKLTNTQSTSYHYPHFHRHTRIHYQPDKTAFDVKRAPQKIQKTKRSVLLTLLPMLSMMGLTVFLRGGQEGSNQSFMLYTVASMGLASLMAILQAMMEHVAYRKATKERIMMYNAYMAEQEAKISQARDEEKRIQHLIYMPVQDSVAEIVHFGKRLFERLPTDEDFLHVYLGQGIQPSVRKVNVTQVDFADKTDPLFNMPDKLKDKYEVIENMPIVTCLLQASSLGIVGSVDRLMALATNISLDIAVRHFYQDVKLTYILKEGDTSYLKWVRWLKNVSQNDWQMNTIAGDIEGKNILLEHLYAMLSKREQTKENLFAEKTFDVYHIVFVSDIDLVRSHPLAKYFINSVHYGVVFIFMDTHEENIPQGCGTMVRIANESTATLIQTCNGDKYTTFTYPTLALESMDALAIRLGAIEVADISLESELTKHITLFELLGIFSVDDLNLKERWENAKVYKSLAVPLGVKAKDEIVYLDISDKANAHGPHGLVAGTTGSGKSEILQTYVLSIASLFHPYEVGVVLIDFKGGGMANQFKDLPHLLGTITNIDGREIDRSLLSIKAELIKRQEKLSQSGVNHINDYIQLYQQGKVVEPLPHLIIIVDEFAELKAAYPDFMKEIVSAARIGRTLGIHLILATQKPAGVVDAQIWSNSRFKLCLKVQTKEDSQEMLKNPLAAEITEAGRAYFQVGNNEIFELFQSAYSGAEVPSGNDTNANVHIVYEKNLWGKPTRVYTNEQDIEKIQVDNQLQALVRYIHQYCQDANIKVLSGICTPSLEDRIAVTSLSYDKQDTFSIPIGVYDDPEHQQQGQVSVDLLKENTYIVGSTQSGKTTLLQTILYGIVTQYTTHHVHIYIVDCGSMVLKSLENSYFIGGVVLPNEEEKCKNLFKLLSKEIDRRKQMLSDSGVGSYSAYIEAGYKRLPLIVLMIDNIAAFKEYFPQQMEQLDVISREAQSVGISLIVTSPASNALSYRTQAYFSQRFVLNCHDSAEYGNVLSSTRKTPKDVAGRGLFIKDKRVLEYQTAIFDASTKAVERHAELQKLIAAINQKQKQKALDIPIVPEQLILKDVMKEQPNVFTQKGCLPIGMNFDTVEYEWVRQKGVLVLVGEFEQTLRFVQNLITVFDKSVFVHETKLYIADSYQGGLKTFGRYECVEQYSQTMDSVVAFCKEVERREPVDKHDPIVLIIQQDLQEQVPQNSVLSRQILTAFNEADKVNAMIVYSAVENQVLPAFNAPEILKWLKEKGEGVLFAPIADNKFFELHGLLRPEANFNQTMAYVIHKKVYQKIKVFK